MRHVFVETNWLVGIAAPSHDPTPAAVDLLTSASKREIQFIFLPAVSPRLGRLSDRSFSPRKPTGCVVHLRWAIEHREIDEATADAGRMMLQSFEGSVTSSLSASMNPFVKSRAGRERQIVPLDADVLDMSVDLHFKEIEPSEFDRAVLAAVLITGRRLRESREIDVNFAAT